MRWPAALLRLPSQRPRSATQRDRSAPAPVRRFLDPEPCQAVQAPLVGAGSLQGGTTHQPIQGAAHCPKHSMRCRCGLVFAHMKAQGGVPAYYEANQRKAQLLYDAIEGSGGFYASPVNPKDRRALQGLRAAIRTSCGLRAACTALAQPKAVCATGQACCSWPLPQVAAEAAQLSLPEPCCPCRSQMNVPFTIPAGQDLEKAFISQATKEGMVQLKGHR